MAPTTEAGLANRFEVVVQGTLVPRDKLKHYHSSWRRRFGDLPFDYEAESILLVAEKSAAIVQDIGVWFQEQRGIHGSVSNEGS
jgi:hypothetical protein